MRPSSTADRLTPSVSRHVSFGFVNPNGSVSYAFFPDSAGPIQVAEAIAKEAGGGSWPLRISGKPVSEFDFKSVKDGIHDITWGTSKDLSQFKKELQKDVDRKESGYSTRIQSQPNAQGRPVVQQQDKKQEEGSQQNISAAEALRAEFTESRAKAVEAEFGQLIIGCLDNLEETVDILIAKKVELLREKALIEATIEQLEIRIDKFKGRAIEMVDSVDPYEQDVNKLTGGPV